MTPRKRTGHEGPTVTATASRGGIHQRTITNARQTPDVRSTGQSKTNKQPPPDRRFFYAQKEAEMTSCSLEGCGRPHYARTWCTKHYARWHAYGDPTFSPRSAEYRFASQVAPDGDCLVWTGYLSDKGYAVIRNNGKPQLAHRYSYESSRGPIPDGMHIDHICHNRACVKPEHLRLATPKQNAENLSGASSRSKSGVRGVTWDYESKGWRATVGHYGRQVHVGRFASIAEAEVAVVAKRLELHTHNDADRKN